MTSSLEKISILITEDCRIRGRIQENGLKKLGASVKWAKCINKAVDLLLEGKEFCAYICDGQLPANNKELPSAEKGIGYIKWLVQEVGVSIDQIICTSADPTVQDFAKEMGIIWMDKDEVVKFFKKKLPKPERKKLCKKPVGYKLPPLEEALSQAA